MSKRKTVLPGHMKKAIERVEELAATVDLVFEVVDARAPRASCCPVLTKILVGSYHVKVLAKTDLAAPAATRAWKKHFKEQNIFWTELPYGKKINAADFLRRLGLPGLHDEGRMIKALIIGIPNVGKSTLTNLLVGRRRAPVGARPGITRGLQLIKLHKGVFLFDTPGVINPVIHSETQGNILGLIGCLQDSLYDKEAAAFFFADLILSAHRKSFEKTFALPLDEDTDATGLFEALARRRGFLLPGAIPDIPRACALLINDFSTGRFKGISLESPDDIQNKD